MTDAGIEVQPDHRVGSGKSRFQIVAHQVLNPLIGKHRKTGNQAVEGSVISGLNNGLGKVFHEGSDDVPGSR